MKHYWMMQSPIGPLYLMEQNGLLCEVSFQPLDMEQSESISPLLCEVVRQLQAYFDGELQQFNVPLHLDGTPFQMACWKALSSIPYGTTISYKQQAQAIDNPKAVRAVGGANNANKLAIILPCHRVVGVSGKLVGYAGGLHVKEYLLKLEQTHHKNA